MKTSLPLLLSLACLVSCSCSKSQTTHKPETPKGSVSVQASSPPIPLPVPGTFTGSNWSIVVPPTYQNTPLEALDLRGNVVIEAFFTDKENQRLLTVAKEPAPEGGLDEFVMNNVAQMMNNGINVNTAAHTILSGMPAGMIDSSSDVLHVWVWLTVKGNDGYTFACGGAELTQAKEIFEECKKISESMKIQ